MNIPNAMRVGELRLIEQGMPVLKVGGGSTLKAAAQVPGSMSIQFKEGGCSGKTLCVPSVRSVDVS